METQSMNSLCAASVAAFLLSLPSYAQEPVVGIDGGSMKQGFGQCISAHDHALLAKGLRDYEARFGPLSQSSGARWTQLFPHYPIAGNISRPDLWVNNFVDLDPATGLLLDWDCTEYTYDGHRGSDTLIRTFDEQTRGVPIYAVLDGIVVYTHDGEFDRNVVWDPNAIGNAVTIDHGNGILVKYWHMKNGSVAVNVGQQVVAGEQIGLVGSSGISNYPHLHLGVTENGQTVEPWTGPCNPGTSLWENQIPIDRSLIVFDHGISYESPMINGGLPYEMPRSGEFAFTDGNLYTWFMLNNLPADSTWRQSLYRPDGSAALIGNVWPFTGGSHPLYRFSWWSIWVNIPELHTLPGTWRQTIEVNGTVILDNSFEVVPTRTPGFNRAPETITAELDPPAPFADDVIVCRVDSLLLDDLDYDVLRYHYVWTVDGVTVRDVTHAGLADILSQGTAMSGQSVQCAVAVGDDDVFLDPFVTGALIDGGMQLMAPNPGVAGQSNLMRVENAQPQQRVFFAYGFQLGTASVPGCAGLSSPIQSAQVATNMMANSNGVAVWTTTVPPAASGRTVYIQAVQPQGCMASNMIGYEFP
jgi:hypothetical protein